MKIYAHRGFSFAYPEASRIAYESAVAAGAAGLECDIRLTCDGIPICFHDRTTERIAGVKKTVSKTNFEELSELVNPVSLDQLLELADKSGVELLIETKHPVRTGPKVEGAVLARIAQSEVKTTLISFSLFAVLRLRRKHLRTGYVIARAWRVLYLPTKIVAIDYELYLRSRLVRRRLRNREILLWTVNDPDRIRGLNENEIVGVITDRPDLNFRLG